MSNNRNLIVSNEGEAVIRDGSLDSYKDPLLKAMNKLRTLDLRKLSLKIIPSYICDLKKLVCLDIRENNIEAVPEGIRNLVFLEVLKFDRNNLTILPWQIFDLTNLKTFTFSHNSLLILDRAIGKMSNLMLLDLSYNQIQVLPRSIGKLKMLSTLYVHANEFSKIPAVLHKIRKLQVFSLDWLRYTQPSLPIILKGTNGEVLIKSLQNLSSSYSKSLKNCEISVTEFLKHFTEPLPFPIPNTSTCCPSLLHKAVLNNDFGVIKGLIESGNDLDLLDSEGYSALVLAVRDNNPQTARLLIESGSNVNIGGGIYGSALHLAVAKNESYLASQLLKNGSRTDLINCDGNSPLHILMVNFKKQKHTSEIIGELLISAGADTNAKNNDNWGPIHIAARKAQNAAVKWIRKINSRKEFKANKFDVNLTGGKQEWTSLHLAAHVGLFKTIKILLKAGADVFARNQFGKTPRDVAKGNLSVFKYMSTIEKCFFREYTKKFRKVPRETCQDEGVYMKIYEDFKKRDLNGIKDTIEKMEKNDLNTIAESDAVYLIGRIVEKYPKNYLKKIAKNSGNELCMREAFAGLRDLKVFEKKIISPKNIIGPRVSLGSQISSVRRKNSEVPED